MGLHVSKDTVEWWSRQSLEARKVLMIMKYYDDDEDLMSEKHMEKYSKEWELVENFESSIFFRD